MTDEATEIVEKDDDFSTPEPDAAEILYDDDAPVEIDDPGEVPELPQAATGEQGVTWTESELQAISRVQHHGASLQQEMQQQLKDEQEFMQKYGISDLQAVDSHIAELEKKDRNQAVLARTDLRELKEKAAPIRAKIQNVQQASQQVQDAANYKRMVAKEPALAKPENREMVANKLLESGVPVEKVSAISADEAVSVWKLLNKNDGKAATKTKVRRIVKPKQKQDTGTRSPGSLLAQDWYGGKDQRRRSLTPRRKRVSDDWDDTAGILYGS